MKIGILGTGDVATNLAAGLTKGGHAVKFGDAVILAVPFSAVEDTVNAIGADAFEGKTLIDATNVFPQPPGWGASTSGAEEIAKLVPGAKLVKAFNTAFAGTMSSGRVGSSKLVGLVAADDTEARKTVLRLAADLGFDAVDAGPLNSARYMEAMALMTIRLGFEQKMGTKIGFALVR